MEFANPAHIEEVRPGMIVEAAPAAVGPRASDRNIAVMAEDNGGHYQPSRRIEGVREILEQQGKDPEAFIRSHVRRLEALRRAGHVERINEDNWRVPRDITERGMAYDLSRGGDGLRVRTVSAFDLERQIGSDGATWLDRELVGSTPTPLGKTGFGQDVMRALDRRAERLVGMGHATVQTDGSFLLPRNLVATLERQEVERVGQEIAKARGLTFQPVKAGEYVRGTLAGSTNLASGQYAMVETTDWGSASCRGSRSSTSASADTSVALCGATVGSSGIWAGSSVWVVRKLSAPISRGVPEEFELLASSFGEPGSSRSDPALEMRRAARTTSVVRR
jgi:Protein of unknown function (DUF3363)